MFNMLYRGLQIIVLLMVSIMLSVTLIKLTTPPPIKMVSVDVAQIIKNFAKASGQLHLSDGQQKALSQKFAKGITEVTESYSKNKEVVILVSGAVVTGVKDVTAEIQAEIFSQIDLKSE